MGATAPVPEKRLERLLGAEREDALECTTRRLQVAVEPRLDDWALEREERAEDHVFTTLDLPIAVSHAEGDEQLLLVARSVEGVEEVRRVHVNAGVDQSPS